MFDRPTTNLLTETLITIAAYNKKVDDVSWVGADGVVLQWDDSTALLDVDYYDGYGGQEINSALVVMFNDGTWLSRWEYDGSEGWQYNEAPRMRRYGTFLVKY